MMSMKIEYFSNKMTSLVITKNQFVKVMITIKNSRVFDNNIFSSGDPVHFSSLLGPHLF